MNYNNKENRFCQRKWIILSFAYDFFKFCKKMSLFIRCYFKFYDRE